MVLHTIVTLLRQFRSLHKWIGISVVLFMLITACTGILLGWKKNSDILQPPTVKGTTTNLSEWVSFEVVAGNAERALYSVTNEKNSIDRFDVRPDKGIIKVLFLKGYWEVQIDGKSGKALSVAQRHSDWIEHIHDGSIISETVKLIYTSYTGIGLLILSVTGFFLWYGPRKIRAMKEM